MKNQILDKIKEFVAIDELKKAIDLLRDYIKEKSMAKTIINLSGRFRELEVAMQRDILDWETFRITKAKIRLDLLDLVDALEAVKAGEQEFIFNEEEKRKSFKSNSYKVTSSIEMKADPDLRISKSEEDLTLESLLLRFLSSFDRWYFSPLRIQNYGGKQSGFEELRGYSTKEITKTLLKLLKEKKIKTTTSKKGNPIYKIK